MAVLTRTMVLLLIIQNVYLLFQNQDLHERVENIGAAASHLISLCPAAEKALMKSTNTCE